MIRVLLADDADDMRLLIRVTLENDGRFEVIGDARDGARALELLEQERPDVILLDMGMPKLDGLQVLTEMHRRGLHSNVVAFSGYNAGVEEKARALGAVAYLRKGAGAIRDLVPNLLAVSSS